MEVKWRKNTMANLPKLNYVAINKDSVVNYESFLNIIDLYDLKIIAEEPKYYILDGSDSNLESFKAYWNSI